MYTHIIQEEKSLCWRTAAENASNGGIWSYVENPLKVFQVSKYVGMYHGTYFEVGSEKC